MEQIDLFAATQVLEEIILFLFSKYLKKTINGILTGEKTLRERARKNAIYLQITP